MMKERSIAVFCIESASFGRVAAGSIRRLFGVWGFPNKQFCMDDRQGGNAKSQCGLPLALLANNVKPLFAMLGKVAFLLINIVSLILLTFPF